VQPPLLSFALFLSHPEISVLDPLHLDSADDLNFGATVDRGDRDSANARYSHGSYEAVFGPDVNIEYAGVDYLIESSPYHFCIFPFFNMQNYESMCIRSIAPSLCFSNAPTLCALMIIMCSGTGGWHALLQQEQNGC
jgi:hypothetical protein